MPMSAANKEIADLHKRIETLELKLNKLPELEIKNSVLVDERNQLLKQLNDKVNSVECKKSTRDVGMLFQSDEIPSNRRQLVEMASMITNLQEKLDEQTLVMQKPSTRDVAIMHVVDKIDVAPVAVEKRDVAINHRTDDDELIRSLLASQKHELATTYIRELDVLKLENQKLSTTLDEAIKRQSKSVVTRGTHACEEPPQLYSVGCMTQALQTRDVQVMFTPKCRDVALSTDRFNYTRDVSLYCNMDSYDDIGNEQISTLFELKKYGLNRKRRYGQQGLRDVCVGVNLVDTPKVTRDVKCGVNLECKEVRDVSIGCAIDVRPSTRDVCMAVNLDERQMRDVCCGSNNDQYGNTKDACIFVNLIEPVCKPEVKHVNMQTVIGHQQTTTSTSTCTERRDDRDFAVNVSLDDVEKVDLRDEVNRLQTLLTGRHMGRRDVSTSMDYTHRMNAALIHNASTSVDTPRQQSKFIGTDTIHTRETHTNTDMGHVAHKAIGDHDVNDGVVNVRDYNAIKTKLRQLEVEHAATLQQQSANKQQADYVVLCGDCGSVCVEERVQIERNIGPHVLSINVPDSGVARKETDYEKRVLTRYDSTGKRVVSEIVSVHTDDNHGVRSMETWSTNRVLADGSDAGPKTVKQLVSSINESSQPKMTTKISVNGGAPSQPMTSITIPVSNKDNGCVDECRLVASSLQLDQFEQDKHLSDEYQTISAEEIVYKNGEVFEKHLTGK